MGTYDSAREFADFFGACATCIWCEDLAEEGYRKCKYPGETYIDKCCQKCRHYSKDEESGIVADLKREENLAESSNCYSDINARVDILNRTKPPQRYAPASEKEPQIHADLEKGRHSNCALVIMLSITAVLLLVAVVIRFAKLVEITGPAKNLGSNTAQEAAVYETDFDSENPGVTADEQQQQLTDDDYYLEKYSAPLQRYLSIVNGTAAFDDYTDYDTADYMSEEYEGVTSIARWEKSFGYELRDLDGDGTKELLIALCQDLNSEFYDQVIYDMYTLKDGVSMRVFVSGERFRYYLMEDGRFYFQGSSGAADSTFCAYYYESGQLIYDQEMGVELSDLPIVTANLIPITDDSISYQTNEHLAGTERYNAYVADVDLSVYESMDSESHIIGYIPAGMEVNVTEYNEVWGWVEYVFSSNDDIPPYSIKGYCNLAYITSNAGCEHETLTEDTAWRLMLAWDKTSTRIYDYVVSNFTEGVDYSCVYTFTSCVGTEVTCPEMGNRNDLEALLSDIYTPSMVYLFMQESYTIDPYIGYAVHKGDWAELENGTVFFIPNYGMGQADPMYETLSTGTSYDGHHYVTCDFIFPGEAEPSYYVCLGLIYTENGWRIHSEAQENYLEFPSVIY